jgi:hypothetical protein
MLEVYRESEARATEYAVQRGCAVEQQLGYGCDGIVLSTSRPSAIKAFRYERLYQRERDVYLRLQQRGILDVRGFAVPQLVDHDEKLWCVEMTIVRPPFVLDFAGAYLDTLPDYPEDVMDEWHKEKQVQFESRWPEVQAVMRTFRSFGIYLADVKPGNIEWGSQ